MKDADRLKIIHPVRFVFSVSLIAAVMGVLAYFASYIVLNLLGFALIGPVIAFIGFIGGWRAHEQRTKPVYPEDTSKLYEPRYRASEQI